jgi:cytochrome c553
MLLAAPAYAQEGAALYAQRCASCHEGGQVARAPARDVIAALTPDRIVGALESGTMRVQGETLTPEQRRAIAAYLSISRPAPSAGPAAAPVAGPRCEAGSSLRPSSADWRAWGVTPANDRFQRQPGFSSAQAAGLKLRWAFGFDGENAAAANPTIAGDRASYAGFTLYTPGADGEVVDVPLSPATEQADDFYGQVVRQIRCGGRCRPCRPAPVSRPARHNSARRGSCRRRRTG